MWIVIQCQLEMTISWLDIINVSIGTMLVIKAYCVVVFT